MRNLTDNLLEHVAANSPTKKVAKPRILKKDIGTVTDQMDVNMLSAADEFFIEFELNKKYCKSIDDLKQMKNHLKTLDKNTSSDAAHTLKTLGTQMNQKVQVMEEQLEYEPEQFDSINAQGW